MTVQRLFSPGLFRKKQILQVLGEAIFKLYLYVRGHGRLGRTSGSYGRFSAVVFFFRRGCNWKGTRIHDRVRLYMYGSSSANLQLKRHHVIRTRKRGSSKIFM